MATIRVHTAQNVTLEYEVASLGDRIVATLLDSLVLGAAAIALLFVLTRIFGRGAASSREFLVISLLVIAVPFVFYHLLCEVFFNGQSIGKKARHIKVVRLDGTAPKLGDYLLRWLLRIVDLQFAGLVAVVTVAANGRGQRLGDLAAGTTVISVRVRPGAAAVLAPDGDYLAGYQVVFPQAASLADHDVSLIRQLMQQARTRDDYDLLNQLANKVKALTGIQTDLQDGPFLQTVLRDYAHLAHQG